MNFEEFMTIENVQYSRPPNGNQTVKLFSSRYSRILRRCHELQLLFGGTAIPSNSFVTQRYFDVTYSLKFTIFGLTGGLP